MVKVIDQKTLNGVRNGVSESAGKAWKQARIQASRVEFRTPWVYTKPSAAKPWFLGIAIFTSVIAVIAGVMYYRKRKQVSDRYTMGESEGAAGETSPESINSESLAATP
ncbi:MAG: hypothetical protein JWP91_3801 [Fibrobacteres bacterium]|nr:hypothetical protein [Fibrobacterota bacterium]